MVVATPQNGCIIPSLQLVSNVAGIAELRGQIAVRGQQVWGKRNIGQAIQVSLPVGASKLVVSLKNGRSDAAWFHWFMDDAVLVSDTSN